MPDRVEGMFLPEGSRDRLDRTVHCMLNTLVRFNVVSNGTTAAATNIMATSAAVAVAGMRCLGLDDVCLVHGSPYPVQPAVYPVDGVAVPLQHCIGWCFEQHEDPGSVRTVPGGGGGGGGGGLLVLVLYM